MEKIFNNKVLDLIENCNFNIQYVPIQDHLKKIKKLKFKI